MRISYSGWPSIFSGWHKEWNITVLGFRLTIGLHRRYPVARKVAEELDL